MLTNEDIVRRYRKSQQTGKWNAQRESWLRKLADRLVYGKIPRRGSTEMSPVINNDMIKQNRRVAENGRIIRGINLKPGEEGSVTKGEAIEGMLYPWSAVPNLVSDAASIVINPARNLYNTAADIYNAGASERNAINQNQNLYGQGNL